MKKSISIEEYHSNPSISKSKLDLVNKSLLHYLEPPTYNSASLSIGSAVHDAVLLPEVFKSQYVIQPKEIKVRNGKKWDAFLEENKGKSVLKQDEYNAVLAMRDRLFQHPLGKQIFTGGEPEQSYFTEMNVLGLELPVRCRPDYVNENVIIDLKTCASAHPDKFRNSITNFRYHVQAAFYLDIINKIEGTDIQDFMFVAIETTPPYAIGVYVIDRESVDCGRDDYMLDLEKIAKHKLEEYQPTGYTDDGVAVIGCNEYYFYKKIKGA